MKKEGEQGRLTRNEGTKEGTEDVRKEGKGRKSRKSRKEGRKSRKEGN